MKNIKTIAFDADDTLWVNLPNFHEAEQELCNMLSSDLNKEVVSKELFKTEMKNLPHYGYGAKSFTLSMIETFTKLAVQPITLEDIQKIIQLGKTILTKPVELLDGVENVLIKLSKNYRLVVATKGDLFDQERKLADSGLEKYFHHIEIMSDKKKNDYLKLLKSIDCAPENFLMVGNSLKSDVVPVLNIGAYAVHIPFHSTWEHEKIEGKIENAKFRELENMSKLLKILP